MTIKQILDKAFPITDKDRNCRFRMAAKKQDREELQRMIEQYLRQRLPVLLPDGPVPDMSNWVWERTEDGAMVWRPKE